MVAEIDWHKIHTIRLAACCQRAATDFNLSITSPFILNEGGPDEHRFIALFPRIGPLNGTVVCLASDWDSLNEVAHAHGYTCVGVPAESCASYEATRWGSFIREWDTPSPDA
ncbi:MAG: hypothetical protein RL518_2355 [Pseudomonadota bacterium]|jgi:hypothetical protein